MRAEAADEARGVLQRQGVTAARVGNVVGRESPLLYVK
jgi:hypothetical protein